ncbi:MAG: hypothetical protein IBX61_09315 [Thermoleophilia bacterium]|nr:hypothetical protein [Thermoleophilia bacterium]
MLPIPFATEPPGNWLRPAGRKRWCFTRDVQRARADTDPPILSLPTKFRPAIIFACQETIKDPLYEFIPALPLYTYKGTITEAWARAMPNMFHVPAHTGCSLVEPSFGDFSRMFVFRKSWLLPDFARLYKTEHHDKNPVCRLSDTMMQEAINNFAVYLTKMAGFPMEESD